MAHRPTLRLLAAVLIGVSLSALAAIIGVKDAAFLGSGTGVSTDWSRRVVNNGGALPSQNTIACMETLRQTVVDLGFTNKIYAMAILVPDGITAGCTPLFYHYGSGLWTNSNFVSADLTVHGLKGDGSTKVLDTGVRAQDVQDNTDMSKGMSLLVTESFLNISQTQIGHREADDSPTYQLNVGVDQGNGIQQGETLFLPIDSTTAGSIARTNDFTRVGWVSANVITNAGVTNISIYAASPVETFKTLTSRSLTARLAKTTTTDTISVFALKYGTTNASFSDCRISAVVIHDGLTATESSNLWVAIRTCRECLGGGNGDPVYNWDKRVQAFGGAATSASTKTAISNCLVGMDTDATLYRFVSANCIVPDNLTAARVPFIWQWGAPIWTNVNFGTTNLSVNGLQGNGTDKYLQVGLTNSTANNRGYGGDNSAGISVLMHANPDTGVNFITGSANGTAQFALFSASGTGLFRCWRTDRVNTNFVTGSVGTTTNGWLSGSRTSATGIFLYKARSDVSHVLVTNGNFAAQTGSALGSHAQFVFTGNSIGTPTAYTAATLSFVAFHAGMTQTETSNVYVRVNTLRTALGGGSP